MFGGFVDMVEHLAGIEDSFIKRIVGEWPTVNPAGGYFLTAPGRVNLIGEHVDYSNCPVLPIAVDKHILAYVVPMDTPTIQVADLHIANGSIRFTFAPEPPPGYAIPSYETGHWGNYIKAAIHQLLLEKLPLDGLVANPTTPDAGRKVWDKGFSMVFSSTIPQAAGMSSSSALVVLSAIAFLEVNHISYETVEQRLILADICRRAEMYVGTRGGGMDQAAIIMGKENYATKISFNPLSADLIPFGQDCAIVVTHSTIEAPKTRAMMEAYNRRSIECALAAAIVSKVFEMDHGIHSLEYIGDLTPAKTGFPTSRLDELVAGIFHEDPYSPEEIAWLLGISVASMKTRYCRMRDGSQFPIPPEGFKLYQRFFHVWNEWKRVEESLVLIEQGQLDQFGKLMDASHASCRDYHEVSCPQLDTLTEIARTNGAMGSRLTGAGFGGCAVSLVAPDKLESFIQDILSKYYGEYLHMKESEARQYVFVVKPSAGAGRYQVPF